MLTIRTGTATDIPALYALNSTVQTWHASHYPERFHPHPGKEHVAAFFTEMLERVDRFVHLACIKDACVGYTLLSLNDHPGSAFTRSTRHMHVEHIAVAPAHRRQGVARALLDAAETLARDNDCTELNLTSWTENAVAQASFAAHGFATQRLWMAKPL